MKAIAFCDGSGNSPRGSSAACVVMSEDGTVLKEASFFMDPCSNNIAEYQGAILAVKTAIEIDVDDLEIFSDSQLIVNQINENWDVKDPSLKDLRDQIWNLASSLSSISISWVPREENKRADFLCRSRLDTHSPKKSGKKTKSKSSNHQRIRQRRSKKPSSSSPSRRTSP